MTKPVSLISILRSWVRKELPKKFWVEALPDGSSWLGFIRCDCKSNICPAATARIEKDRICLLRPMPKPRSEEHLNSCQNLMKVKFSGGRVCYCGEQLIMLYDIDFTSFKKRLMAHHTRMRSAIKAYKP